MATVKAAAAKYGTRELWNAKALALAEVRNLMYTARLESDGEFGRRYHTPNGDRRGAGHTVHYGALTGTLVCDCTAGTYQRPCGHAGAVLKAERMREQALATDARRELLNSWMRGLDW